MKLSRTYGMRQVALHALLALLPVLEPAAAEQVPQVVTIEIKDFAFVPASLAVRPGTTVIWKNLDDEAHTVVSDAGQFRSSALDTQESYSYTFTSAGTYRFVCSLHSHMTGVVKVE
jgi:plastocyanin